MLSQLLKIALFTILIPLKGTSQSVTDYRGDSVCFDVVTASKIMNDIEYLEKVKLQKSDSIATLKLDIVEKSNIIEKKENQIQSKNTGLWIQGGAIILEIIRIIFVK